MQFPLKVQKGDIIVADESAAVGAGDRLESDKGDRRCSCCPVGFFQNLDRNGHEVGLPILEVAGIHDLVSTGDRLRIDITTGIVGQPHHGKILEGSPGPEFLMKTVEAGGLMSVFENRAIPKPMTLLLNNEEVEKALTPRARSPRQRNVYRELAEGAALMGAQSGLLPVKSKANPGFRYRFNHRGRNCREPRWALRITSDMAGHSFTAGVKCLPVATGNRYCGLVILFDIERIEPIAIMPDGATSRKCASPP